MRRKITAMLLVVVLVVVMASPASAAQETWDINYHTSSYMLTIGCTNTHAYANIQTVDRDGTVEVRARGWIFSMDLWKSSD